MNYPLISEYIEAIKSAEDNFEELTNLRPILDDDGEPVMTSGNFAVVFKMKDVETGKLYALKCFTKEQEGREEAYQLIAEELEGVDSPYIVPVRYLEKELFVDTDQTDETEFPVLLMEWVEGQTLDKYLRENLDDKFTLEILAYRFSQMAQWLIPQHFAHGDLKPDNILVRDDGTLVLVDYDGMYVPAMKGQKARELGSPDFRHPLRTEDDFDEHIDDFPIVSILLSLKAISLNPQFLEKYGAADRLLFSEKDYRDINNPSALLNKLNQFNDTELIVLISMFTIAVIKTSLSELPCNLLNLQLNVKTSVTDEDFTNAWTDEFGAKYSADKKRLLRVPKDIEEYSILNGTRIICDFAFPRLRGFFSKTTGQRGKHWISNVSSINIPDSVTIIGDGAFRGCSKLSTINIPDNVIKIGDSAFLGCIKLSTINIPNSAITIGNSTFSDCGLTSINIPDSVTSIGNSAFSNCYGLTGSLTIPNSVTTIGSNAFSCCTGLTSVEIPESVTSIGNGAFWGCKKLKAIEIPNSVISIGFFAFTLCDNLETVIIPNSVMEINHENLFWDCTSLSSIYIPNGTMYKFKKLLPEYKSKLIENNDLFIGTKEHYGEYIFNQARNYCKKATDKTKIDYVKAFKRFLKAANMGISDAQCCLGCCYRNGYGTQVDISKAIGWYEKSSKKGCARAFRHIAICYEKGQGVDKNIHKAIELFNKAIDSGDNYSMIPLGDIYFYGKDGISVNYEKALKLYKKAAEVGEFDAMWRLGRSYYLGKGIENDCKKATEWFAKAADNNNSIAQWLLGHCYEYGQGVKTDINKAFALYKKAAEQGSKEGQWRLGYCYEKGLGTSIDIPLAVSWYDKAAKQGHKKAEEALDRFVTDELPF